MNVLLRIDATEKDTQFLLEALHTLDDKLSTDIAVSSDARLIAGLQNDQAYIRLLLDDLRTRGAKVFGDDVLNVDRTPL